MNRIKTWIKRLGDELLAFLAIFFPFVYLWGNYGYDAFLMGVWIWAVSLYIGVALGRISQEQEK